MSKAKHGAPSTVITVPIGSLKGNPKNPRVLRDEKFAKLKKSIKDFPDMLNYRTIVAVTDGDKYMVLGGNMRLRALQDLGIKTAPVMLADHWTEEQRREFIIKDNVGFGEWNWSALANEWDDGELADWGLDVPGGDSGEEDKIETVDLKPYQYMNVLVSFTAGQAAEAQQHIEALEQIGARVLRGSN